MDKYIKILTPTSKGVSQTPKGKEPSTSKMPKRKSTSSRKNSPYSTPKEKKSTSSKKNSPYSTPKEKKSKINDASDSPEIMEISPTPGIPKNIPELTPESPEIMEICILSSKDNCDTKPQTPKGNKDVCSAKPLTPKGNKDVCSAKQLTPKGNKDVCSAKPLTPKGNKDVCSAKPLTPKGNKDVCSAKLQTPKGNEAASSAKPLTPKGNKDVCSDKPLTPKGNKDVCSAKQQTPKGNKDVCSAKQQTPKGNEGSQLLSKGLGTPQTPEVEVMDTSTSSSNEKTPSMNKKMTPKQLLREAERNKKREEREKLKIEKEKERKEKEKERKEKEEERRRVKEEKNKRKIEELEVKQREKDEKRQKKEEDRMKKEEEKNKKEEEKKIAEEEAREKEKKAKAKFARFFVAKKPEQLVLQKEPENTQGPFMKFQVKENMKMAPIVRECLSKERRGVLDAIIGNNNLNICDKNYLQDIKDANYKIGKLSKTNFVQEKLDNDDDCEIIDDEDDEIMDVSDDGIIEENKINPPKKAIRAKLLQFCENRRPAYYGTWSKNASKLKGKKPFEKEEIFDYEYDSDEDWEEEEAGESLSDSEGEGEEAGEEEVDQYEVDNDFFVPHGYLSDDEGKDEKEEDEEEIMDTGFKDESVQKEQLKQKQAEFELEMKQKTKQLKPKVYGCVWIGDKTSHTAYDQLVKVLSGHRAMMLWGSCPISTSYIENQSNDHLETTKQKVDEENIEDSAQKRFVRSFPDKAVPDLIRLIHGNCNTKLLLVREFSEYWKRKCPNENVEVGNNGTVTPNGCIAKRKIEPKIQELAIYGRFTEDGVTHKYRSWYVPKETREKYGLGDLSYKNSWNYIIPPKNWRKDESASKEKEESKEKMDTSDINETPKNQKSSAVNLITRFTKILNEDEKEELLKKCKPVVNSLTQPPLLDISNSEVKVQNTASETKLLPATPGNKPKKKIALTPVSRNNNNSSPQNLKKTNKNSIVSYIKKTSESANTKPQEYDCVVLE